MRGTVSTTLERAYLLDAWIDWLFELADYD